MRHNRDASAIRIKVTKMGRRCMQGDGEQLFPKVKLNLTEFAEVHCDTSPITICHCIGNAWFQTIYTYVGN